MVRKKSKQPRTFLEEAGPSSKADIHAAASDSPQSLDGVSSASSTSSSSRITSIRDQEETVHASQRRKLDSPIPAAQSSSESSSEALSAPQPDVPGAASRQSSAEQRARRIRREQIRHQVCRTLDLISMVCWGDEETALATLRRSYLDAMDRIDRGDGGALLFRPGDPYFRQSNRISPEGYQDWVLPLGHFNLDARQQRHGRRRPRHRPYPGGINVMVDGRDLDLDLEDQALVVRLYGRGGRSTVPQSEARQHRRQGPGESHGGRRHPRRPACERSPPPPPAQRGRGQGSHLRESLRDASEENQPEPEPSASTLRASQNHHSATHIANTTAPSRTTGRLRARASRSPEHTWIPGPAELHSPHHTSRYRRAWEAFNRREVDNPLIPPREKQRGPPQKQKPRQLTTKAQSSTPQPGPDNQGPDPKPKPRPRPSGPTPITTRSAVTSLSGQSRHHCLGSLPHGNGNGSAGTIGMGLDTVHGVGVDGHDGGGVALEDYGVEFVNV
ncbi:uncharacterized protein Z520_03973 [Fonsecaea multimorphosa CBS 102226]|uniref:Uncharacterized protein n=1 Tax=Fonsecaea multimorphosa CBS 102226 TaxID=1442371 RepID=A0A0D2K379_9EURO|nr:uncharacterized protein Z520_03973 [Fonsecaea multimorphosa CBS 102226]KIY00288.1 hypothetical protein Z520_03973 [Fonsecaea multimorphosa CBS 102226]OAL27121.1 hypothetical protein AYO22_03752 [Fonsecaea multimorphosa]